MLKTTNIKQLLGITLKNFFDIDIAVFINLFLAIFTLIALVRLYLQDALNLVVNGLYTMKQDLSNIKLSLLDAKENWDNTDLKETMINTFRALKHDAA